MGLLKSIMQDDFLKSFNLVGGTALALQLGHRISEDLDLFSDTTYELIVLKDHIQKKYSADIYALPAMPLDKKIKRLN